MQDEMPGILLTFPGTSKSLPKCEIAVGSTCDEIGDSTERFVTIAVKLAT